MKPDFRGAILACLFLLMGLSHAQGQTQVVPSPEFLTMYRATSCTYLRELRPGHPEVFDRSDAPKLTGLANVDRKHDAIVAEWESQTFPQRAAFFQALRECDTRQPAAQPAVNAPRATPEPARVAPVAAGLLPQIGARVDTVSPGFAQSLGLRQAAGALVVEAEAGGPAQKAGLQALDVIMEITGQQVQSPADLQESLARMRSGFKAQLRVWRNKAMRDIVVTIADMPPAPAVAAPPPPLPAAAAFPQPGPPLARGGRFGLEFSPRSLGELNTGLLPPLAALLRTSAGKGLPVSGVRPGSPAERAGLQVMDVLIEIDGQPTNSYAETLRIIQTLPIGQAVDWVLLRQGVQQKFRGASSSGDFPPKPLPAGASGVCFSMVELAGVTFSSRMFSAVGGTGPAPSPEIAGAESEFLAFLGKHLNANPGAAKVQTHCATSSQQLEPVFNSRTQAAANSGDMMRLAWRPLGQ